MSKAAAFPPLRAVAASLAVLAAATAMLMWAAVFNRFPLIFPDSGAYLGIALAREYAIDRSSMYGFLLKPIVTAAPGVAGLWLAIVLQAAVVAAVLIAAGRRLDPAGRAGPVLACIAIAACLTSLPWHAAQFMPDALTGPVLLLAWLAASRDPGADGAPTLWLAAAVAATTHYTHLVLLGGAAAVTILAHAAMGLSWRACARRALAALLAVAAVAGTLVAANALFLGRASVSPMGSLFLYARLNEDGLIPAWLDRHCGRGAPERLCATRAIMPRDSQKLLWSGDSPIHDAVWKERTGERWQWIDAMAEANRGAIAEAPMAFLHHGLRGGLHQLASFAVLDDECPVGCRSLDGGVNYSLGRHLPEAVASLQASRQVEDSNGRPLLRAVTTPVAVLALLLLPLALTMAWRRRDGAAASLLAVVGAGLLANAAMAGALSDVHDRYQSRVVWLAPFALLLVGLRWWRRAKPSVFATDDESDRCPRGGSACPAEAKFP